jgi:molybdate transport system substrate-binding protein
MNKTISKLVLALCALLLSVLPAAAGEINLVAAASLKEVLSELADSFVRQHPSVKIVKNFGGSGTLARQIENGAPADLFISANLEWLDYLQNRSLVDENSRCAVAYNTLVFVGAPGARVAGLADLTRLERIAIGSPKSVPAGEYALEALRAAGFDRQVEKKLVMAKDVREALLYAERGEVDGAFVYRTDALLAKQVKILFTVPPELYPRVTYPAALTTAGAKKPEAREFLRFLRSAEAKGALARAGFGVP